MKPSRESQALAWAAVLLVAALLVIVVLWSSCAHIQTAPKLDHGPAVVKLSPCALGSPPPAAHFATTRASCPPGLTCFDAADLTALLDELEARREYDQRAAACAGR